ncbi:c6 finger domain [Pyrenophora seminiperda CCB06]|uniref:C6 finger domain n=1 Tax=Pyrenophora seminiperda CCB06 TaxID=1302712 RepID=A0A3M7MIH6_9PLEO|nr:c6 finger domain [Pyrenophora seminiperda CCB06]
MAEERMLPRSEIEFDFDLPHGIDPEEDVIAESTHADTPAGCPQEPHIMNETRQTTTPNDDLSILKENTDLQKMSCILQKGLADDGDDSPEAIHRPSSEPSKSKRSPRTDDGEDEESPESKKICQSLFGPFAAPVEEAVKEPVEGPEEENFDYLFEDPPEDLANKEYNMHELGTTGTGIGGYVTGLDLEQQIGKDHHPEPSSDFKPALAESNQESLSPIFSPLAPEEEPIIPYNPHLIYDLRTGIDRNVITDPVDQDESGNFDPAEEMKQRMLKLQQAKVAKSAQRSKKGMQPASKEKTMKLIVKLYFEKFGNVRNITNDEDNWPDDWSMMDSEDEREAQEIRTWFRRNTPNREAQIPIKDPCDEVDDLTGYPAARGCKTCREEKLNCSLVTGGFYPCQQCLDEDYECQLIIPPTQKGPCKQCVEDGNHVCSFENDPNQAICDWCLEGEYMCHALPPEGYRSDRVLIDEIIYGEDRPHASCTVCRQEKKRCSLKEKTDKPPCKYCTKHNIGCTFYNIPKVDAKKTLKATKGKKPTGDGTHHAYFTPEDLEDLHSTDVQMKSRSPTPEIEMEDELGHKGMLTKINTSFSHPIQFDTVRKTLDCNFCELPIYGFVGLFEKQVHVIRWYDGLGYTEVGGGHAENNGPTTMCLACTIGRLQIISCANHTLQPIYPVGIHPSFEEVLSDLLEVAEAPDEINQELQRWCSMCFTPAMFACCTRQVSLNSPEDAEEQVDGCGLKLCNRCEKQLREDFGGDSSAMAATLDHEPKVHESDEDIKGLAIRADISLLTKEGLLMRNLEHEAEQAVGA